jgi:hypothetical protein
MDPSHYHAMLLALREWVRVRVAGVRLRRVI